jgi:RHS repeat-associated protein
LLTKYYTETGSDGPEMYFRYDPYGTTNAYYVGGTAVPAGVAYDTDRLYTGQRWDSTTLFYDYGARFYDPRIAHFLSQDPAGEYTNPYAYVAWNPVMRTDPSGMFSLGAFNIYFDQGGPAYAAWYASWSGGIAQGFGGFGGLSGLGAFISSSIGDFDQSFSIGGHRYGGVEAGALGTFVGTSLADFDTSIGELGIRHGGVETPPYSLAFSASPLTANSLVPSTFGQLLAAPLTLLASLIFYAFSGLQPPLMVSNGSLSASFFSGNPLGGYFTVGDAIWGPTEDYTAFAEGKSFSDTSYTGQYLSHEFGHISQYSILGPAFVPAYVIQFPVALAAFQNPFQFNILENFFLGGAPGVYELPGYQ